VSVTSRRIGPIAAALLLLFLAGATFAADSCPESSDDCVAVGGWSLSVAVGAGLRTNPLVHGKDIPLIVVPQFSYYGRRFFIDNLDPGVTLVDGDSNTLSLIASPGYDRVFFYRSDLQNIFIGSNTFNIGSNSNGGSIPIPGRGQETFTHAPKQVPVRTPKVTYLAGPEWTFKYAGVTGQLDYLHEITGHNHGDEIRAALKIPLGTALKGSWGANVGVTWKSTAEVNYYYGYPGLYEPGWALNPFAKIGYTRSLSRKWTLDAFVHCERLGNAISDSPVVDRHYVTTAFVGATYVFHK
jgi:outer membrane protein